MSRKDFRKHVEVFSCAKCGSKNLPQSDGQRNHCSVCLYSLHVDDDTPGDRKARCGSLMEPFKVDFRGAKGFLIVHRCVACGKEMGSRLAADDDVSILSRLSP